MLYGQWKPLLVLGFLSFIIVTLIFLLTSDGTVTSPDPGQGNTPSSSPSQNSCNNTRRTRLESCSPANDTIFLPAPKGEETPRAARQISSGKGSVKLDKWGRGPDNCGNYTNHSKDVPRVCMPGNDIITVIVKQADTGWGNSRYLTEGDDEEAYITAHWWGLVCDPPGYSWKGWSGDKAERLREMISCKWTKEGVELTVNTSRRLGTSDDRDGDCVRLTLWGWGAGSDRNLGRIRLCVNSEAPQPLTIVQRPGGAVSIALAYSKASPPSVDDFFQVATGISASSNNWLLLAEQAAISVASSCVVCLGARPVLKVVPADIPPSCLIKVMNNSAVKDSKCSPWDKIFPVVGKASRKPIFSTGVAPGNFTCITFESPNPGPKIGSLNPALCSSNISVPAGFSPVARADIWWWCGGDQIYDGFPRNVTGHCALITLLLPVNVYPISAEDLITKFNTLMPTEWGSRAKRSANNPWLHADDPTYIDAIGVPRGVPDKYKLVNQVAAGFESFPCWWCTINKNVDRINYIHYNIQRLGNQTEEGFLAVHEQLKASSLVAFQNRVAVDMLLAEKGGVCAIFGEQCCTFIPNNTAPNGRLSRAIEGLRTLNKKMMDHSGVDTLMWDNWMQVFGKYKSLISSMLVSLAVFASILTLCGCCCIPCLRSLANRLITTAIEGKSPPHQMMPLLRTPSEDSEAEGEKGPDVSIFNV